MGSDAPPSRHRNQLLRSARSAKGWSQEELACQLQYLGMTECGRRLVQRWESGEVSWPQGPYRKALETLFGCSITDLGFVDHRQAPIEDLEPMQYRRQVIASAAALTAAAISDFSYASYARLEYALRRGRMALTASDGDHLQAETQRLYERETLVPASVLAPEVDTHLATLSGLLALPLGDSLRRVVALCASETALLGGWLALDRSDLIGTQGFWNSSIDAAGEAGDGPALAATLAYMSYAESAAGNHQNAWQLLETAGDHVHSPRQAKARSWIAARQAEEAAALNEHGPALIALERAMTVADYIDPEVTDRPWVIFFDSARLGSMAVSTYAQLNHPRTQDAADAVLASLGPNHVKTRAVILGDVANARLAAGDLDAGCALAGQALEVTVSSAASLGRARLTALRPRLEANADAAPVRALLPRLDAAGITVSA